LRWKIRGYKKLQILELTFISQSHSHKKEDYEYNLEFIPITY